ncbi:MAG: tRNA (adenosine(37)-N6)-dimethylallyltransferase MiaA [Leptolyngbyaceae cyanobacterium bins.59]|nr:tRNA (adenosine(37)-N6)-dimethylallyltransferase MiaA [Leptolyngbyaceae cyanobacterium bins.59]
MKPGLIVICGPTATGKSGLAIDLAKALGTVILSADSRACYRTFDIGTAKPTLADRQQVPHYLIDICEPTAHFTVAEYQEQAQRLIKRFHFADPTLPICQAPPLLVGGTGLYIKAIVRGLKIPRVPPCAALRSQLASLGQSQLYQFLQQVDPLSAQRIQPKDQVRTLRALEVYYTTGVPLSQQQGEAPPTYPILQLGIDCKTPDALERRIAKRTEAMLAQGFVAEVKGIVNTYGWDLPLLETLGYQEMKSHLQQLISLSGAEAQIILHTRQFAKRQRTWFRADRTIRWFDADDPHLRSQVWQCVQEFLQGL